MNPLERNEAVALKEQVDALTQELKAVNAKLAQRDIYMLQLTGTIDPPTRALLTATAESIAAARAEAAAITASVEKALQAKPAE